MAANTSASSSWRKSMAANTLDAGNTSDVVMIERIKSMLLLLLDIYTYIDVVHMSNPT
jgi:hypothetical protein